MNCKRCLEDVPKIRSERCGIAFAYRDLRGARWNGRVCPTCRIKDNLDYNHRTGRSVPIDRTKGKTQSRGRHAERLVAEYFKQRGFDVKMTTCNGPDLTISKAGDSLTVEVKSMTKVVGGFVCSSVKPTRLGDDLMALVFIEERVIMLETMQEHLNVTPKSGCRYIHRDRLVR
jgi:hypothetical protein